jgi:hypothetical protein
MNQRSIAVPVLAAGLLCLGLIASATAAVPQPHLRSARAAAGHIVVVYTLGDQAPSRIVIASRRATGPRGVLLSKNVRLSEPLSSVGVQGGAYRARTRHALRPGRYFVQVSATELGLDCTPRRPCRTRWSNVLPARVPRR